MCPTALPFDEKRSIFAGDTPPYKELVKSIARGAGMSTKKERGADETARAPFDYYRRFIF